MLACISLKEKKKNAFAFAKKKRVVVLPPFYIYSYIGISSSAFLTIILFSKKNPKSFSFFLSFWPGARHPWLYLVELYTIQGVTQTLSHFDYSGWPAPALDADCYLRNGLMPARISKWKDNKRLFFFLVQICWQDSNYWTGKMDVRGVCFSFFFFSSSPFPTVSIARTVIIGTNGQVNWRLGGNGEKTNNGLLV